MLALARRGQRRLTRSTVSSVRHASFFEWRTDHVQPAALTAYFDEHEQTAGSRTHLFPGWLGLWKTELGGHTGEIHHLYEWKDYDERDAARKAAGDHALYFLSKEARPNFNKERPRSLPLPSLRQKLSSSSAVTMVEATACLEECGLPGSGGFNPHPSDEPEMVAWELRKYQLQLGYDTVPRFLELYKEGLKDKLAADDSGASELATLLYSDSGPLNVVVELWRHETMQRAQDSRKASRKATKWRSAINEIAKLSTSFDTRFMRPMRFSPWR